MRLLLVFLTMILFIATAHGEESIDELSNKESSLTLTPVLGYTFFDLAAYEGATSSLSGINVGASVAIPMDFWDSTLDIGLTYLETGMTQGDFLFETQSTFGYLTSPVTLGVPLEVFGVEP